MAINNPPTRRVFLGDVIRVFGAMGLCGTGAWLTLRPRGRAESESAQPSQHWKHSGEPSGPAPAGASGYVWQIDPDLCIACGGCQKHCVLDISAVKAVQCFALCGYCDVCTGYFPTQGYVLETGAENHLCPTGAITRRFVERHGDERFFEYTIDEQKCIACGKCVAGCRLMNGSLYLQVRHDRCVNCNECAIAVACPAQAFRRVPASQPYLLGKNMKTAIAALERRRQSAGTTSPQRG